MAGGAAHKAAGWAYLDHGGPGRRCAQRVYPWLNGRRSGRSAFSFTCWGAAARMIAEPTSAGPLTWTDDCGNTTRESAPSRLEGGNGLSFIPNVAEPVATP